MKRKIAYIMIVCMCIGVFIAGAIGEENFLEPVRKLFNQGKYQESLSILDKLLKQDPNNAEFHAWKGRVLGTLSRKASELNNMIDMMQYGMQAMQELETAVQLDPNNLMGRMGHGMAQLMAPSPFGNVDVAISDFQKVVELDTNHVEGHFHLGLAYLKKGEIDKAKVEFEKTLQLKPDHADAKSELEKIAGETAESVPRADSKRKFGDSWYEVQNGFSILHLKGSPYDMGYQQGMVIKDGIGKLASEPAKIFGLDEQKLAKIREATKGFDKFIPEEYRAQMRGLAAALEVSYDDILMWNTFTDVMFTQSCTNFLALGETTADGKVIHGANLEFGNIIMNRLLTNNGNMVWLVIYEPNDGHKFATVTPYPIMVSGFYLLRREDPFRKEGDERRFFSLNQTSTINVKYKKNT